MGFFPRSSVFCFSIIKEFRQLHISVVGVDGRALKEGTDMSEKEGRRYPRAKLKWRVLANEKGVELEGVTKNISPSGAYVCCARPLRLNEVFDMVIEAPDKQMKVKAEVVWSNIYGPNDEINPRAMAFRSALEIFKNLTPIPRGLISSLGP